MAEQSNNKDLSWDGVERRSIPDRLTRVECALESAVESIEKLTKALENLQLLKVDPLVQQKHQERYFFAGIVFIGSVALGVYEALKAMIAALGAH